MKVPRWKVRAEAIKKGYDNKPEFIRREVTCTYTWKRSDGTKVKLSGIDRGVSTRLYALVAKELGMTK